MAVINGTTGADSISGTGSSGFGGSTLSAFETDVVFGNDGADTVIGNTANASPLFVFGGNGDDSIVGGGSTLLGSGSNSVLRGDVGADTLIAAINGFSQLLDGGTGDDRLEGGLQSDLLQGGGGSDTIFGKDGHDTILDADGNNSIDAGVGNDTVDIGGLGANLVSGGAGQDLITAVFASGANTLRGDGENDTIVAGFGNDSITGDDGNDTIHAGEGNNTVLGGTGADRLAAGDGADSMDGGDSGDRIDAGNGANTVNGGASDDRILTGTGDDLIFGGANDTTDGGDFIDAHRGNNTIFGGGGDDRIYASNGNDSIDGQDGNDNIHASEGNNTLLGGLGNDNIYADFGADSIDGGDGNDFIEAGFGNNTVLGGIGNDYLVASGGNDSLVGGAGNDSLVAAFGADTVLGEDGNDWMDGGDSADRLIGGNGNDTVLAGGGGDTVIGGLGNDRYDGGDATDTLDYTGLAAGFSVFITNVIGQQRAVKRDGSGAVIGVDIHANFETFLGSAGHDRFIGYGTDETFIGGAGNDTIDGGAGFDTVRYDVAGVGNVYANLLTGIVQDGLGGTDRLRRESSTNSYVEQIITGGGADTLIGDSDGNFLRGGAGADSINGGEGGDHADYSGDADANGDGFGVIANIGTAAVVIAAWGTEGAVTVQGGAARDSSGATDMLESIENLRGTAFHDRLVGNGEGDNFFRAVQGADTIDGGFGYDYASHRSDSDFNGDGFGAVVNLSDVAVSVAGWGTEGAFTLAGGRARDGWSNIDVLLDIEGAVGSMQHDLLVGRDRAVDFTFGGIAFSGEDRSYLRGLMGADTLRGIEADDGVQADYRDDIAGVVVRLDLGTAQDGWGFTDVLQGINGASGSMMDDLLVASATGSRLRGRAGDDTLQGGAGFDLAAFVTGTTGVHAVLDNGGPGFALDGEGGTDVLIDIEGLTGGSLADTLVGNDEDNLFFGGRGADSIVGGLGEDMVTYYTTWKTVNPTNVTGVSVNLNTGVARDGDGSSALGSIDRLSGIEHAIGSHLSDTLIGSGGANSLMGADGNDSLVAGSGNDVLEGGIGADTLNGGSGTDMASYASSATGVNIDLRLAGVQGGGGDGAGDLLVSIEQLLGSALNDTLIGESGANLVIGGAGNDLINGSGGNDTIDGGAGRDTLLGGVGNDLFRFSAPGDGQDRLQDFASGQDLVALVGSAFGGLAVGALDAGRFAVNAPGDADDVLVYIAATRVLQYDADGNGAGAAVSILQLTAGSLTAADIVIV